MWQYVSKHHFMVFEAGGVDGRMKRAIIIFIAVLAVMLVYPSTNLLAKSPPKDAPTKSILPPTGDVPLPPWITDDDDPGDGEEPGDADDLAGNRGNKSKLNGSSGADLQSLDKARFIAKIWWLYFMVRLF
jgi:hypothetical protein